MYWIVYMSHVKLPFQTLYNNDYHSHIITVKYIPLLVLCTATYKQLFHLLLMPTSVVLLHVAWPMTVVVAIVLKTFFELFLITRT